MTTKTQAPPHLSALTSIITLDVDHPATRAVLIDAHQAHRLTMSGYAHLLDKYDFFTGIAGGHPDHRASLNILYALSSRPNGTVMIRLQSDAPPDFANPACHWWRDAVTTEPVTRDWTIPADGRIAYQLRGNPITRINGRRRWISDPNKQLQWWHDRAAAAGLKLDPNTLIDQPIDLRTPSKNHHDKNKPEFILKTLRYTGTATITDPDAYRAAIIKGIGRGQAYGAGLLLTATKRA